MPNPRVLNGKKLPLWHTNFHKIEFLVDATIPSHKIRQNKVSDQLKKMPYTLVGKFLEKYLWEKTCTLRDIEKDIQEIDAQRKTPLRTSF